MEKGSFHISSHECLYVDCTASHYSKRPDSRYIFTNEEINLQTQGLGSTLSGSITGAVESLNITNEKKNGLVCPVHPPFHCEDLLLYVGINVFHPFFERLASFPTIRFMLTNRLYPNGHISKLKDFMYIAKALKLKKYIKKNNLVIQKFSIPTISLPRDI